MEEECCHLSPLLSFLASVMRDLSLPFDMKGPSGDSVEEGAYRIAYYNGAKDKKGIDGMDVRVLFLVQRMGSITRSNGGIEKAAVSLTPRERTGAECCLHEMCYETEISRMKLLTMSRPRDEVGEVWSRLLMICQERILRIP